MFNKVFGSRAGGGGGGGTGGGGTPYSPGRSFFAFNTEFTSEKHLGEGAFAQVYQVRDMGTQQEFALKVASLTADTLSMVEAEVGAMKACQHDHLLRLHAVEFRNLQGQPLQQLLRLTLHIAENCVCFGLTNFIPPPSSRCLRSQERLEVLMLLDLCTGGTLLDHCKDSIAQ